MVKKLFLISVCLFMGGIAHADDAADKAKARDASIHSTINVIENMADQNFMNDMQNALDGVVAAGVQALNDHGYHQDAAQFEQEWHAKFSHEFGPWNILDLGDHKPLSQWLANFYNKLEARLTYKVCHALSLDDIKVFNFGIPVTIHPAGWAGDSWDKKEYGKHFVPVAGAIAYWATRAACNLTLTFPTSLVCFAPAGVARFVTVKWIAPPLSNYVYDKANGCGSTHKPSFEIEKLIIENSQ